ncbi:MAG: AI-2E family transporter [Desulfovibrionaceae bacterium]
MSESGMSRGPFRDINSLFLFLLLGFALYLAFILAAPFIHTLIFSAVVCAVAYPLFGWMHQRIPRRSVAAFVTTGLISVLIVVPLFFLTWGLAVQGAHSVSAIHSWAQNLDLDQTLGAPWVAATVDWVQEKLPYVKLTEMDLHEKVISYSQELAQYLLGFSRDLLKNLAGLLAKFLLMTFIVFFFLRDGQRMVRRIKDLAPLRKKHEDVLIESMQRVSRVVFAGSILVAALQGVAGGVGFSIVGIPGLFWGTMMAFAALIPVVGASIIWWPAVAWLALSGEWGWALFLAAWCLVLVVNIDTFLRPMLLRGASKVSTFYIFMAILGGVAAFGFKGILYGPLVLSFVMIMLDIYAEEYSTELDSEGAAESCADTTSRNS